MSIRAVFFDLDDTLILTTATRPQRARLSAEVLLPHAAGFTIEALVERMLPPDPHALPIGAAPVIEELGLDGADAATRAVDLWYFRGCEHLVRSPAGADTVVEARAPAASSASSRTATRASRPTS